jgi:hypothetical protein
VTTVESVLAYARQYVEHIDARRYSHAHHQLTLLADAVRKLPPWELPPVVEPAAEVERTLTCGATLRMANEDGALVLVVRDEETAMAPVLTREEALQARADLARVLAAIGGQP